MTSIVSCDGGRVFIIGSVGLLGSTAAVILAASAGPALAMAAFFEGGTLGGLLGVLIVLGMPGIRRGD